MRQPILILAAFLPLAAARADVPMATFPECGLGGACPMDYHPNDEWNFTSSFPDGSSQIPEAQRAVGAGMWIDRAWAVTTGRTDVVVAVLDSGIRWDGGNLLDKYYLHAPELPFPQDAAGADSGTHDRDGNGVFNMADFADDPRLDPAAGDNPQGGSDGVLDPSDLIAAFSDGIDDDGNGYVDDICGWDFFWDDNNPYDDTLFDGYSHGTAEARMVGGEGNDGDSTIGVCPNCPILPLRVGDSFVTDVNHFAFAAIYAVDLGVSVIESALGTLNNSPLAVEAIEYAWDRGVTIMGSAADECAYHMNMPSANHHTVYIHAIRYDGDDYADSNTFMSFSNGTNYGPRLQLSASGTRASSEAAARGAGIAGLVYSAARDALEDGTLDEMPTSSEVYQILTRHVHDVSHNPSGQWSDQYPSRPGWDRYFGYGRMDAFSAVRAVRDGEIPPEADILSPDWLEPVDPVAVPRLDVRGYVAARRSASYGWTLEAAAGMDPEESTFRVVAEGQGTEPQEGVLASVDLAAIGVDAEAPIEAYGPSDTNVMQADKAFVHAATLRLRVTDAEGRLGEMRKVFHIHRDPSLLPGLPAHVGTSFESSIKVVDVNGDGRDDLVFVTSDGLLHVTDATATDLPGWPQNLPVLRSLDAAQSSHHLAAAAFESGDIGSAFRQSAMATPAVGDLDGDGQNEIVLPTLNGALLVFGADGSPRPGFPFWLDRTLVAGQTDEENRYDYGFFASAALSDLDADGDLEIVVGAMDARVYAFDDDGSFVDGFPVELRETWQSSEGPRSNGERIISSPAVGDIDGDGLPEIVLGTNQKTTGTYGLAYALRGDGSIVEGWPLDIFGAYTAALPYVGEGVPGCPTICDLDGDGASEIAVHTIADAGAIVRGDASRYARLDRIASDFGLESNTSEENAAFIMINSGAWGDMDGDGTDDYLIGSMGLEYASGGLDDGHVYNHDHLLSGWSGLAVDPSDTSASMPFLRGFPRVMEDFQFFLNPIVADIDGDGAPEAINGSAGHVLHAFDERGREPVGWPKQLGYWVLGSPAVGDVDGDGFLDVWATTRAGRIYGFRTTAEAATAYRGWTGFRNDAHNSGDCAAPQRTYPPIPVNPPAEEGCGCAGDSSAGLFIGALALGSARRRRRMSGTPTA